MAGSVAMYCRLQGYPSPLSIVPIQYSILRPYNALVDGSGSGTESVDLCRLAGA